ncbi:hypothetical protein IMY05_008G0051300 [Salix suchowensis]|nr:hypothetical protein IMY05_008G0051300 [Salix suchowensis]
MSRHLEGEAMNGRPSLLSLHTNLFPSFSISSVKSNISITVRLHRITSQINNSKAWIFNFETLKNKNIDQETGRITIHSLPLRLLLRHNV